MLGEWYFASGVGEAGVKKRSVADRPELDK